MPIRPSEETQGKGKIEGEQPAGLPLGTNHESEAISKFDCRFSTSVSGVTKAQATPRFKVKLFVTRQLSCTNGRNNFQRRPTVAPWNVWSWAAKRPIAPTRTSAMSSLVKRPVSV